MSTDLAKAYHLPVRPYSPIDALNRRAAGTGSPGYAQATAHANYNGHHVTLTWNSYRGYYVAEYFWAGRNVIARGSFASCLAAVLSEYQRGDLGACATIAPREDDTEAVAMCEAEGSLAPGDVNFGHESPWYTWRHKAAAESVRDAANPRALVRIFDWTIMQAAETLDAYEAAIKAKHGRIWA
jgi:hypothetical protein